MYVLEKKVQSLIWLQKEKNQVKYEKTTKISSDIFMAMYLIFSIRKAVFAVDVSQTLIKNILHDDIQVKPYKYNKLKPQIRRI